MSIRVTFCICPLVFSSIPAPAADAGPEESMRLCVHPHAFASDPSYSQANQQHHDLRSQSVQALPMPAHSAHEHDAGLFLPLPKSTREYRRASASGGSSPVYLRSPISDGGGDSLDARTHIPVRACATCGVTETPKWRKDTSNPASTD